MASFANDVVVDATEHSVTDEEAVEYNVAASVAAGSLDGGQPMISCLVNTVSW